MVVNNFHFFNILVGGSETVSQVDVKIAITDQTPRIKFHNYPDPSANFASLAEDVRVGQVVSVITVTDGVVVRITGGNEAGLFRLDRHHDIRVSSLPEMKTRTEYRLTVEARDRVFWLRQVSTASLLVKVDTFPALNGQYKAIMTAASK